MPILFYNDFRGGLWKGGNTDLAAPASGLIEARNVEYFIGPDETVWIRGRRGRERLNTGTQVAGKIVSMWRLYRKSDGPFTIIGHVDANDSDKIHHQHDATNTGILTALTGDAANPLDADALPSQWITFPEKDAAYAVNGANGLKKYDGSEISEVSLAAGGAFGATGSAIGPYITLHKQQLWVTDGANPNSRLYAFRIASDNTVPATNQLLIEDPRGGRITGLSPWNDLLLIFKDTGIFRFSGSIQFLQNASVDPVSSYGCIAPRSIAVTPDGVMYLSRDGLRLTDGQHSRGLDVSPAIRPLFVSPGTQHLYKSAVASFSLRKNQYRINLDGGDTVHILQRLEMPSGPVWLWSTASDMEVTVFADAEGGDDNGRVYAGDGDGKTWEIDVGEQDIDGSQITDWDLVVQVPFSRASDPAVMMFGQVTKVAVEWVSGHPIEVNCYYDNRKAIAHQYRIGLNYPNDEPQLQYAERPVTENRGMGRWVSTRVTIRKASYKEEIHQINTNVSLRGIRARERREIPE